MKIIRFGLGAVIALAVLSIVGVWAITYHPGEVETETVIRHDDAPTLKAGQNLRVLSWNIQFLAGNRDNNFFYDGGNDPWPNEARTREVAAEVAAIIDAYDPDLVLLQEVDDGADRTHNLDQLALIQEKLSRPYPYESSSFYWKAGFVPAPGVMGAAGMKLSVLSKYKIDKATRHALPAISTDDILRRQFNLKRAVQVIELPLTGAALPAVIMNTHLSAFAQGSDTMDRQVAFLTDLINPYENSQQPWLVAGDFNLLSSKAAYDAQPPESQKYYNPDRTELTPMLSSIAYPNNIDSI